MAMGGRHQQQHRRVDSTRIAHSFIQHLPALPGCMSFEVVTWKSTEYGEVPGITFISRSYKLLYVNVLFLSWSTMGLEWQKEGHHQASFNVRGLFSACNPSITQEKVWLWCCRSILPDVPQYCRAVSWEASLPPLSVTVVLLPSGIGNMDSTIIPMQLMSL